MHGSDQGCWIRVCENTLSKCKWWICLFKRESGSACFGDKMAPCLWRADLSFMNSVTGSGNVAMCSNMLQDKNIRQGCKCSSGKHTSFSLKDLNYKSKKGLRHLPSLVYHTLSVIDVSRGLQGDFRSFWQNGWPF